MGRARDERPEIEVLGPAGSTAVPTVVQRGGPGSGPSRRTSLLIGVAVVVLLVAGLLLGGGGGGEQAEATTTSSTSTTRPTTTTSTATTTTTLAVGPVLDVPTGVLVVTTDGDDWTVFDADTGTGRSVEFGTSDGGYGGVGVRDGVVLLSASRTATYWDLSGPTPVSTSLGAADQVLSATDPASVWVVDALGYAPPAPGDHQSVRLVGLDGKDRRRIEAPAQTWIAGVTDAGAIAQGGGRIYVVDEDGPRPLVNGDLVAVVGGQVLVRTCDDAARCTTSLVDPATGARHATDVPASTAVGGASAVAAPAGEVALLSYDGGGDAELWVLDGRGRTLAHHALPNQDAGILALLPGALGWLYPDSNGEVSRATRDGDQIVISPAIDTVERRVQMVLTTRV